MEFLVMDEKEFDRLYTAWYPSVRDFIRKYVHSAIIAEDLTQEVFMKVWSNRQRLEDVQHVKTYIFTIARNHTLNSLKVMSRSEVMLHQLVAGYFEGQQTVVEDDLQFREYMTLINQVLDTIPQRSRTIFRLCREEGKSYAEVAADLGISTNAIKNHMVNTMKILKTAVENNLGIPLPVLLYFLLK